MHVYILRNEQAYVFNLCNMFCVLINSNQVVLVGHGIGGGSVSYAAEKFPEKVQSMIFIAAIMPKNGFSILQSFPPGVSFLWLYL